MDLAAANRVMYARIAAIKQRHGAKPDVSPLEQDASSVAGATLAEQRAARRAELTLRRWADRDARAGRVARVAEHAEWLAQIAPAQGGRRGKPLGKHLEKITEDLLVEAHALYWTGRDKAGRPMGVRKVAAAILPRTGYKSDKSCANCIWEMWKARGWPLRERVAASVAATLTHGELVGTKDWRDPAAAAKKNAYRRRRRAQDATYAR